MQMGAQSVIGKGLRRLLLHHGHMLVGRGVEDDGRLEALEDSLDPLRVGDVGDEGGDVRTQPEIDQFLFDLKQQKFAPLDQQQLARGITGDLPAEFTPDAAAGSRHHHHLVIHQFADPVGLQVDGLAAEQILNLDRPDLGNLYPARQQLLVGRHDLKTQLELVEQTDDDAHATACRARHGNDDFVELMPVQVIRQGFG